MTVAYRPKSPTATADAKATDGLVEDLPAGPFRVNRKALIDEDIFREEMRSIFDRCWLYVGHESEIPNPGDFRARDVGNRPLVFWHGHDGVRRVFYNSCRHRGALVCRLAEGNAKTMSCFYHAWTFASDGALNGLPDEQGYGPGFDRARMSLLSPRVESYRGFVFACYDPGAVDLRTYLAGAADYIDLVADQAEAMEVVPGAHEFSMDANWKLYVENSLDGYHVLPLHVTYFEFMEQAEGGRPKIDADGINEAIDLGNGHAAVKFRGTWARPRARWSPALGEHNRGPVEAAYAELVRKFGPERAALIGKTDRNVLIFPNLIILDLMGVVIRSITPASAGHTKLTQWSLAAAGEDPDIRARRLDYFITFQGPAGLATPDDLEALEACQSGYRAAAGVPWSDISRGLDNERNGRPNRATDELPLRTFWRRWQTLLSAR